MKKDNFIFSFVVEDYDDLNKLLKSIKNILELKKNVKFMDKLIKEYEDGYIEIQKENLTINIFRKSEDDLPF